MCPLLGFILVFKKLPQEMSFWISEILCINRITGSSSMQDAAEKEMFIMSNC